jgi:hypothetical protein
MFTSPTEPNGVKKVKLPDLQAIVDKCDLNGHMLSYSASLKKGKHKEKVVQFTKDFQATVFNNEVHLAEIAARDPNDKKAKKEAFKAKKEAFKAKKASNTEKTEPSPPAVTNPSIMCM